MPTNKKKNKQKKKSTVGGSSSAAVAASGSDETIINMNARVLEALIRLADTLAQLDESSNPVDVCVGDDAGATEDEAVDGDGSCDAVDEDLAEKTAAASLSDDAVAEAAAPDHNEPDIAITTSSADAPTAASARTEKSTRTPPPALPLSHWRTLPLPVESAYQILSDGAEYIHATSTKYALVGKVDSEEGGNLAVELRKGAELIGTGALLLFSESCGSSRSLRHHVKQSSRAILASMISLVRAFEDGSARGKANDGNNVGAQRAGAVWSACDRLTQKLPRGNRAAMRRELMVWVRDCNESVGEFEEVLALGPRDNDDGEDDVVKGDGEDAMMDEDQYAEKEMGVAKSSVNVMKCSKNLLGLVLKTCECVGEHADASSPRRDHAEGQIAEKNEATEVQTDGQNDDNTQQKQTLHDADDDDEQRKEMLQWISNLHEMARAVGEGVTNLGILLYPPLDCARTSVNEKEELQMRREEKSATELESCTGEEGEHAIPILGLTGLGLQLEHQLRALSECVTSVHNASLPMSGESIRDCLSEEVVEGLERLMKAVKVRCREAEEALLAWDQVDTSEK